MTNSEIKQEFIQDYGEAYQSFGLPKLMGRIIGLMLYYRKPLSLPEITTELNVSKGPVSQITQRLIEHNLIRAVWVPGDRKSYFQLIPDIFGSAFYNMIRAQKRNLQLAKKYQDRQKNLPDSSNEAFKKSVDEMTEFYEAMIEHFNIFYKEWTTRKKSD